MTKRIIITLIFCMFALCLQAQSIGIASGGYLALSADYNDTTQIDATSTVMLFHFDADYTDLGGNAWGMVQAASAAPYISTPAKFGAAAMRVETNAVNTAWTLTASDSATFQVGTGDFTFEFWFYLDAVLFGTTSINHSLAALSLQPGYLLRLDYFLDGSTDKLNILAFNGSDSMTLFPTPPAINQQQWYHCCFERHAGTLSFYLDGVLYNSNSGGLGTFDIQPTSVSLFQNNSADLKIFYLLDEMRFANVAKYQGAFTPETDAFGVPVSPKITMLADVASEPLAGMVAWYDAADATTITASGGIVSEWRDKSGNGCTLTAAGNPTIASETLNGLPAMGFLASAFSAAYEQPPMPTASYTYYAVCLSRSGAEEVIFFHGQNAGSQGLLFYILGFGADRGIHSWFGDTLNASDSTWLYNTPRLLVVTYDGATRQMLIDNEVYSDIPGAPNFQPGSLQIGSAFGWNLNGYIAELICYNVAHDSADIEYNRAYLADKWGL
jgi:hypothetical protein